MLAFVVLATLCAVIDAQNVNLQVRSLLFAWWSSIITAFAREVHACMSE